MLRAFLLVLSCLADYETVRDVAQGASMAGLLNMSVLGCIGLGLAFRRWRLFRG